MIEKEREIIKDLQQQLAEMTEKYNACQEARKLEAEFNSQDKKELKQQLAEKDKENLVLYSMLYETLEKQDCENVASQIDQMTGLTLDKQAEWFKGNRVCDELIKQLAQKDEEISTLYKTIRRISNEKANIINREQIDYLSFATQLRHQVCEEIRCYIDKEINDRFPDNDVDYLTIDLEDFEDLLDGIERKVEE